MAIIENLLSRFGYTKLDARRRDLLARAEAANGGDYGLLPSAIAVAEIVPPVPPAPPRVARGTGPRAVRGTTPPPIPSARVEDASAAPTAKPKELSSVDSSPAEVSGEENEQEWEWKLALARARGRDDKDDSSAQEQACEVPRRLSPGTRRAAPAHAAKGARPRHRVARRSTATPTGSAAKKARSAGPAIAAERLREGR